MPKKTYLDTGYLTSAPLTIDRKKGIMTGVKVCTVGEAKGHGVSLDDEFIHQVVELGNGYKQGLKARFGHPNMCSTALGTFLGRFKNLRTEETERADGSTALTAVADLFVSNTAKETPNGDLHKYVFDMADKESDMFGTSIVFTGDDYKKGDDGKKYYYGDKVDDGVKLSDETFVDCKSLFACDCVDEPAANDGMFSKFANETIAGQISQFLDLNPHVFSMLNDSPEVIEIISAHGDKVETFFAKYQAQKKLTEINNMPETKEEKGLTSEDVKKPEVPETPSEETAPKVEGEEAKPEQPEVPETEEVETIDKAEFSSLVEVFGAEIASQVVLSGGGKEEAYKLQAEATEAKIKALEEENEQLKAEAGKDGGTPAKFSAEAKQKQKPWAKK